MTKTMGQPIINHQGVGFMLADMAINAEAARNLVWRSAWAKDAGERNSTWQHDLAPCADVDHQLSMRRLPRPSPVVPPLRMLTSESRVSSLSAACTC